MFFKRRSRANSYLENDDQQQHSPTLSKSDSRNYRNDSKYDDRPQSSRDPHGGTYSSQHNTFADERDIDLDDDVDEKNMYASRQPPPQSAYDNAPRGGAGMTNGMSHNAMPMDRGMPAQQPAKIESTPDLLTQAFNQALMPYTSKIEQLERQVQEMQDLMYEMEQQRADVHAWIDKRGLRPDVPPTVAKVMDTSTPDSAQTLNIQLDRKITIVNFDLHRVQDDLNDDIAPAHFAHAMLKFLPHIGRLTALPTGPRYAFDLILKLGGNLNSHGGLDNPSNEDLAARRDFYAQLDDAMVEVVRRRFEEREEWAVSREIKRIEKTAAYLRNFGVEPYFPQTLQLMRQDADHYAGAGAQQQQPGTRTSGVGSREGLNGGMPAQQGQQGMGTPPRYHSREQM